jgi:hypothetical protein
MCYFASSQPCFIFEIATANKLAGVAAQALEDSRRFLEFERLTVDNVFVYARLRVLFQGRKGLVTELGEAVAGACSSLRKEIAEENRGAVSRRLATEGFGHPADCELPP